MAHSPGVPRAAAATGQVDRVTVQRVPIRLTGKPTGTRNRITYDLSFALGALRQGMRGPRPDMVVSMAPPLFAAAAAAAVARRYRIPFLLILQDLELQLAEQLDMMRGHRLLPAAQRLERLIFTQASAISVISDPFKIYALGRGADPRRVHVLPNWVDTDFIRPLPDGSFLADRCGLAPDTRIVLYSGNLGEKQGLDMLVSTAPVLQQRGVHVVLVGDGCGATTA